MGICTSKVYLHPPNKRLEHNQDTCEPHEGKTHILICGIDYACDRTWAGEHPLDTRVAFDFMVHLAKACQVETLDLRWNEQCTRAGIRQAIEIVGNKCEEDDIFIFYYTGHGDRLADDDGDEESGYDSAMCLLGPDGNTEPRDRVWMRDDEFVDTLQDKVPPTVKILVIVDCCHSGTLLDVTKPTWNDNGYIACSLSGCQDKQTSAGTGKGGMFSRAITTAVQRQLTESEPHYSVGALYNKVLEEYNKHKSQGHTQTITIHGCGAYPKDFVWPLQPPAEYVSPVNTVYALR